jgi:hypothetical protein
MTLVGRSPESPANVIGKPLLNVVVAASRAPAPILLATLVIAVLCLFGEPVYQVNDDSFLAMVGAGFGVAVHPEPHLVFSHFGYGLILEALSRFIGPNAHGWFTIFAIWLSLVLMIRASFRAADLKVGLTILVVCVGCIYLASLLSAEFTTTAAVLFGAAIAEWLSSSYREPKLRYLGCAVVFVALILSYLIRPESYLMGLIIVAPALLVLCWRKSEVKLRTWVLAICLVIIAIVGFETDNLAYSSSPEWRDIPEYNDLRAQFTDYGRVPWIAKSPEYRQVGWSYYDYFMFSHWYARLPIYSLQNVSLLVKKLSTPSVTIAPAQLRAWFLFPLTSWPLLLTLCAQGVIFALLDSRRKLIGFMLLLGESAAIAAPALTGRTPLNYVWSAAAAITLMALCCLLASTTQQTAKISKYLGLPLIGFFGLTVGFIFCSDHAIVRRDAAEYRDWINKQAEYLRGKVTVWDVGLVWEWLITPTRIYSPFPALKIASIDDISRMPIETAMLRELGIEDLTRELCVNPKMRLICPKELVPALVLFCKEHYGVTPIFKEVADWRWTGIYLLDGKRSQEAGAN